MKACKKYFAWVLPIIVYILVQVMGLIICLLYENVSRLIIKNSKKDINVTMETILLSEDGKRTFSIVVIIMTIVIFGIWHKKIRTSRIGYRDGLYIKRIMVLIILGICMQLGLSSLLNITLSMQKEWLDAYKEHMSWTKTDNGLFTLLFDWEKKEFDLQKTIEQFLNNNINYLQLRNMENSYQTYLNSLGITNYASYEQVKLQIKDCQLQQNELKYEIEKYVNYALSQYSLLLEEIEGAKKQMEIAEQNCILVQAKLERKKGTKVDLYKAYMDRTSSKIAYYKSIYHILAWETIIMNDMYGVML